LAISSISSSRRSVRALRSACLSSSVKVPRITPGICYYFFRTSNPRGQQQIAPLCYGSTLRSDRRKSYKIASTLVRLGIIEAPDEVTAMEKASAEFKVPAKRLMAIRR
jgi:hypothetical protein